MTFKKLLLIVAAALTITPIFAGNDKPAEITVISYNIWARLRTALIHGNTAIRLRR